MANAGVYTLEPAGIGFLPALGKGVIDLSTEVFPHSTGRIATFHNRGYHRDLGSPESLARAELEFKPN